MANPRYRGWKWNEDDSQLNVYIGTTKVASFDSSGLIEREAPRRVMTVTDTDSQHATLTADAIKAGLITHNSKTGASNATTDTAANIISTCGLTANDQCIQCYYVNRGDQTVTLVGGTDVTIFDDGQTVATNESAVLVFRRTSATEVTMYHFGA